MQVSSHPCSMQSIVCERFGMILPTPSDGAREGEDATMLTPGLRIGDFEIVRYADRGTTSAVYEGRHTESGRPVAVKVLDLEWCIDPRVVARFVNEACALAS